MEPSPSLSIAAVDQASSQALVRAHMHVCYLTAIAAFYHLLLQKKESSPFDRSE